MNHPPETNFSPRHSPTFVILLQMLDNAEPLVLDLSKSTAIKTEHFAQIIEWNRLAALDLSNSTKMDHDSSSFDGSENSKESLDTSISLRCGSNHSSESTHTRARRQRSSSGKSVVKDESYLERRRKNNQAAKKSRDAKRQRELQMRNQLILLQHENQHLKASLENCVCQTIAKSRGFIQTSFDFAGSYREPHYLPMSANLRS